MIQNKEIMLTKIISYFVMIKLKAFSDQTELFTY